MKGYTLALAVLILVLRAELALSQGSQDLADKTTMSQSRSLNNLKIFNRKRNAHACIMSIVFIVLYPLGAISLHLPIERIPYLRNSYLKNRVMAMHVPIQVIAFIMMLGGMALGIQIGYDLGFLRDPVHAHVVIGLLAVCTIFFFQPMMGMIQHSQFRKTGRKSEFAYLHRWVGRLAIGLGMINSGLGFQLAKRNVIIHTSSYIRSYALLAIFVSIWLAFVVYDEIRLRGPRSVEDGGEKGAKLETSERVEGEGGVLQLSR